MANLNLWYGQNVTINIAAIATNNSGISLVNALATTSPFVKTSVTEVSQSGTTATAVFATIPDTNSAAGSTGSTTFNGLGVSILWKSGGLSDLHSIASDITLCREAKTAEVLINGSNSPVEVWSNASSWPSLSVSASSATGTAPYVATPTANWTSSDTILKVTSDTSNTSSVTFDKTKELKGEASVVIDAVTTASAKPAAGAAASTALNATSNTITIKNAVAQIKLNDKTDTDYIYIAKGSTLSIPYELVPDIQVGSSSVYNAEVSMDDDNKPDSAIATVSKASGSSQYTIEGKAAGSTAFRIKSGQSATTVYSNKIIIVVTAGDQSVMLNAGDANSVGLGAEISTVEGSTTSATDGYTTTNILTLVESATATDSNGVKATFTGENATFTVGANALAGAYYFRFNGVSVVTVHVQHITVSIS